LDRIIEETAMPKFSIFLSHRSKDASAAIQLRCILEDLDRSGALRVVVSESIPKGDDWRKSIQDTLAGADRFLLLYTDPSQKWDWCLYESGFFSGARLTCAKTGAKFITLHGVDVEPPSPLSNWQTVKGDAQSVSELLEELFCEPLREGTDPIAPKLKGDPDLAEAAQKIATLIRPRSEPEWYSSFIRVVMTPQQVQGLQTQRHIPDDATIESDDSSLALFNLKAGNGITWSRIGAAWQDQDNEELLELWRNGVSEALRTALNGAASLPQLPLFYSHDNRCFHSFLQRLDKMPDDSVRGYVVFTEFHAEDDPRPPGDTGVLTHMLTLGRNFRWGVVEPFIQRFELLLARGAAKDSITDEICKLQSAMARALNDGARANLLTRDAAMAIFADPADTSRIEYCYNQWEALRDPFAQAITQGNVNETLRVLKEFATEWRVPRSRDEALMPDLSPALDILRDAAATAGR
jgi:hypothetical protein